MTTFNEYWNGEVKAEIRQVDFSSDLTNSIYRQVGSPTLFCNKVFDVYYKGRLSIRLCRDVNQKLRMTEALEEAADHGWGRGVNNLREVFEYIATRYLQHGNWWVDDNVEQYIGGSGKFFNQSVFAPEGFVNFANAVDETIGELNDVASQFLNVSDSIAISLQNCENGEEPDFESIRSTVNAVKTWTERLESILWVADTSGIIERMPRVATNISGINRVLGNAVSFSGIVDDVLDSLNFVAEMEGIGNSDMRNGLAALRFISTRIPIFGQIFVSAIDIIPELADRLQADINTRNSTLERIHRCGAIQLQRGPQPRGTTGSNIRCIGRAPGPN